MDGPGGPAGGLAPPVAEGYLPLVTATHPLPGRPTVPPRLSWVLAALVALLVALPATVLGHSALRRSTPSAGAHLSTVPRELRLTFNEAVGLSLARVVLVGPDGAAVELGALAAPPDSPQVVVVPIRGGLTAGAYRVRWRIAGADGHPVGGDFGFLIAPGAAGLAPPPTAAPGTAPPPTTSHHPAADLPSGPGFDAGSPLYAAIRWLTFVGILLAIGAVVFRGAVLPRAGLDGDAGVDVRAASTRGAARAGLIAALSLGALAIARLLAQSYALHGREGALDASLVGTTLLQTTWGWGWLLQVAGTVLAIAGFSAALRPRPDGASRGRGWGPAMVGAALLAMSPALSGHAAATGPLAAAADGVHVLAAGGWLGTLAVLLLAGVPAAAAANGARGRSLAALVEAFSPIALACAAALAATGVLSAALHLPSVAALWTSGYGRTLLVKLALLSGVFATGAYNWRRVRPALSAGEGDRRFRRSARAELAIGLLVLLATAVLVATAPPS